MRKIKLWVVAISIVMIFLQTVKLDVCAEEYVYDDLNRLVKVIYDDGGSVEYVYDKNGNILRTIVSVAEDGTEADSSIPESSQTENTAEDGASEDNTSKDNSSKNADMSNQKTNQEVDEAKLLTSRDDSLSIKGQGDEETKEPIYKADANTLPKESLEIYVQNIVMQITECAKNMFCENE